MEDKLHERKDELEELKKEIKELEFILANTGASADR
jgi:archaellum component FlaC